MVLEQVRSDRLCRRLMTVHGVGPVVALTFRATVDQPRRLARSKAVGAHFGLMPRRFQSGETDHDGRISKCGDAVMRTALYEAAQVLPTRTQKWSWLKSWGMQVARRRGGKKAIVALARRLAVILHRMGIDATEFRWRKEVNTAAA
jgi:transposase